MFEVKIFHSVLQLILIFLDLRQVGPLQGKADEDKADDSLYSVYDYNENIGNTEE